MNHEQQQAGTRIMRTQPHSRGTGEPRERLLFMWRRAQKVLLVIAALLLIATSGEAAERDVVRATLENGLRVVVVRNTLAPAVAIELNYLVGSVEAPPGFPGMAHAQEHMMFRGSPGLSADQIAAIMAATGGDSNAETEQVVTTYTATVASADLEAMLRLEAIRMAGVLNSEKGWAEERGAIEQEVEQDLSSPEYLLYVRLLEKLFAGTPYQHDPLGSKESFDQTTGEMLQQFHRCWYAPNNAVLVLVGDVDPQLTVKKVRDIFGRIPARPVPKRPEVKLQPLQYAHLQLDSNLPYGLAVVAYRLPGFDSPDYAAGVVLAEVLASQRGDLYALVPEGKALSADVEEMPFPKGSAGLVVAAFPQGADGEALIARMRQIVARYLEHGVPPALVAAAKQHEMAQVEFRKNSIPGLAAAWSQAVAVEGRTSPDEDSDAIGRVSAEDVNRVAKAYLANDAAVTALVIPRTSGKPVASRGLTRGKESFVPKKVKPVRLPPWARKLTRTLPVPAPGARPSVFRLTNGLRLVVVPTNASDSVSVMGEVKNNPHMEIPAGKEGVDKVLEDLFSYGTRTRDRIAFQTALDDIAADETAGTTFSLQVLTKHFAAGVDLLAENLLHPALPEEAFKIVRSETAAEVAGELQTPRWLTDRALDKGLYPKRDPKLRHATPETVSALTLDDVKRYHRKVFRPDLTTIVVIGAVTPAQARKVIERYFGSWRGKGRRPPTDLPRVPLNKAGATKVPDKSRTQSEVTLAQTLGITRLDPDYYLLQVGMHVLSGGFYATRLDRDLRQRAGLVYTVDAFLQANRTRSVFGVFYACAPENVGRARRLVERNLYQMQRADVSPAELFQAKTLLLRQMLLQRTSTMAAGEELLHLARIGLPLDEPLRAAKRYRAASAAAVRRAFSRWVRPADFVQVTRAPSR